MSEPVYSPPLAGKRGLILGAANDKSIAWGVAQACRAAGADLCFNYAGEAFEKRVAKLIETMPGARMFPCDVASDASIEAFFTAVDAHWPEGFDFVVHSIAYAEREDLTKPYYETPRANFHTALDVSAYSLVAVSREARLRMPKGGSIMAMTYYGAEKVVPNYNVMGVAKAALEASVRYLAHDLGPQGIRVNAISAGPIKTLSASAISGMRTMLKAYQEVAPLRRNTATGDVGQAAVFLASSMASAITGEVLHVDAGYHALGMFANDAT